jgi:hypothetical protein
LKELHSTSASPSKFAIRVRVIAGGTPHLRIDAVPHVDVHDNDPVAAQLCHA